jgi:hypothetical protein
VSILSADDSARFLKKDLRRRNGDDGYEISTNGRTYARTYTLGLQEREEQQAEVQLRQRERTQRQKTKDRAE